MNNRKLGILLIIIALLLFSITLYMNIKEDTIVRQIIKEQGSCFLEDGTCLHEDRGRALYIVVWIISAILLSLGCFLLFFEKSQKEIIATLEKQKQVQTQEETFAILLKGLHPDEQKVIQAVKEQDGITQQTLRLRTDMQKSKLSIVLDGLEKKGLITRRIKGKTKEVFLKIAL